MNWQAPLYVSNEATMRVKFTEKFAASAPVGIHRDEDPRTPTGVLLQVTEGGSRAFRFEYRRKSDGRQRRCKIGDVSAWPIPEMRKRAAELRRYVDAGGDPQDDLERQRAAPTMVDLWQRFEQEELSSRAAGTQGNYRAMWRDWIAPALGKLKVASVGRDDIQRLHRQISERGKLRQANSVKSLCSTLFTQSIVWKMRDDNPVQFVKGNREQHRQRFLSGEELDRLINVLEEHRAQYPDDVDATMLAALTGARRGEILSMRWRDLDLKGGVWLKPAHLTKQRREHRLTLSAEAIQVIERRRAERESPSKIVRLRQEDDFVFRGGGSKTHTNRLERHWREFRAEAGLADLRFHDLRHSVASFLISAGMSLPVVGSVLGHATPAVTARYAHLADAAQRQATDLIGKLVSGEVKK